MLQEMKTPKKLLIFSQKKAAVTFREMETLKKLSEKELDELKMKNAHS